VDDHRDVGATDRSDEAIEAGGVVEVAVAEDHGLDGLGVDLDEAHVVHEPVGADAGVEEHAVVAGLLGERDERRESVLAPQGARSPRLLREWPRVLAAHARR
jgi:hypothetical protein